MVLFYPFRQSMNATSFGGKSCTFFTRSFHKAFILFETQTKMMLRRHLLPKVTLPKREREREREVWLGGDLKNVSLIISHLKEASYQLVPRDDLKNVPLV